MVYVLALDQGTTTSRAILFDRGGEPVSLAQKEFKQIFPKPGWVEHNPEEIWSSQISVAFEALAKVSNKHTDVIAIGITNQRETTILWDKKTGKPVYNAIVWQDRRTAGLCDKLKGDGYGEMISKKTGLVIDSYFSATKIRWILDNVDGVRELAKKGRIAFGTVDSWLVWNLTGGRQHITDVTNASRTMLFNINTMKWDDELLSLFGIPENILPEVRTSSEVYGETVGHFSAPVRIAGIAGDQQAALFGQMCVRPGMVKNTYGTGCFLMMNIGNLPKRSKNNLITTVGWKIGDKTTYALEGSIFIGGAVVQWLRDGMQIIRHSGEIEKLTSTVSDSNGVYFVPAFAGLGAPHWEQYARGTLVGVTRGTTQAHIARAAIDSIAYQTLDVLRAMGEDTKIYIPELRVDGGASVNNSLMQFQSDLLGIDVVRPKVTETTSLGAAYLAGLAVRYWEDSEELSSQWKQETVFSPKLSAEKVNAMVKEWKRAVNTAKFWANNG
ncbi:MAG: glycerol kinase GlpK [Bacteroidales bacterium]|jgi:glycerol kinase